MGLPQIAFMALIIFLYTFQNFFCKKFSLSYEGKSSDSTPVLTIIGGVIVVAVTYFFAGCRFSAQAITIVLGLINAVALYFYNDFLLKGSLCGPYSVLTVFAVCGGISMPSIAKWICFDEKMTGPSICFLIIVIIAVYLMSIKPSDENASETNKISLKFLLFAFGLFLCNGSYATILAVQQELSGESEKEELIMVTFAAAALFCLIKMLSSKANIRSAMKMSGRSFRNLLIYAFSAAFAINSLVIILLLEINTGVLLTVQNAGVMLVSVVFSMIFFKEKLTRTNVIGCVLMTIGLVGIAMFEKTGFAEMGEKILSLF